MNALIEEHKIYDPGVLFHDLPLGTYRFLFRRYVPAHRIFYSGSTWFGLFKKALWHLSCNGNSDDCSQCHCKTCAYFILCSGVSDDPRHRNPPRPYRLLPVPTKPDLFCLDVTLIGLKALRLLPEVILALAAAGDMGIGPGRESFVLSVIQEKSCDGNWATIGSHGEMDLSSLTCIPLVDWLRSRPGPLAPWDMRIVTKFRLARDNALVSDLDWSLAFRGLFDRLKCYYEQEGKTFSFYKQDADIQSFFSNPGRVYDYVAWKDARRYSSRQNRFHPMGGYVGTCRIEPVKGKEEVWWRWWQTASLFHLGKQVAAGHGKIEVGGVR